MKPVDLPQQQCDECQRFGKKIHRVYKKRRFCSNCYKKEFKRSLCPGCGNYARLPRLDENAKCESCESNVPCVRCKQFGKPVGLITPYGPACASCAHHFRVPEPCEKCGELSTRLTRVLSVDPDLRCCPRCAREGAATCPDCRHHRFLIPGADGRLRCKLCVEKGEVQCVTCNQLMPAGRGSECEECAWQKSFNRRVRIHAEEFENAITRERFNEFCQWLREQMGAHKASLKLKSYLSFFSFLDVHWVGLPSYVVLLEHFAAEGLRRMQTPMLWLKTRYGVEADEVLREEHSDKRRIEETLGSVPAGVGADTLAGYRAYLLIKQGDGSTTIRSVRLSLRAAKSVLEAASPAFDMLPTQKTVTAYLAHTPGQRAAAQGFLSYLNRTHSLDLKAEVSERAIARAKSHKLEATLYSMYSAGGEGEAFERTWIKTALMLLHGVSSVNKKSFSYSPFSVQGKEGFNVVLKTKTYWVPRPTYRPSFVNDSTELT